MFKKAVKLDVEEFVDRHDRDNLLYIEASTKYILEELAIDTLIARKNRFATIYPGEELCAYQYIKSKVGEGKCPTGLESDYHTNVMLRKRRAA